MIRVSSSTRAIHTYPNFLSQNSRSVGGRYSLSFSSTRAKVSINMNNVAKATSVFSSAVL